MCYERCLGTIYEKEALQIYKDILNGNKNMTDEDYNKISILRNKVQKLRQQTDNRQESKM